jgi:DNA-binding transcriptional LysR family regulator
MEPDWTHLRSFLAVAEAGSLSAAARALGHSQPTLGRHVQQLEAQLGTPLFTRALRGLALTDAGAALLPAARDMRIAAATLALIAAGRDAQMQGTVRLTASRVVSQYLLPPMLAALRRTEPGIAIDLVPSDTSENLLFREADIALRMYRPTQLDVVTQHVADLSMGLYAAPALLQDGPPRDVPALMALDFVGFDQSDLILRLMAAQGVTRARDDFPLRCDDQVVYWALVRAGCGVGAMQRVVADADPLVTRIADFVPLPRLPVWLTVPEPLRHTPRVRRVLDHLAAAFRALDPAQGIG